MKNLRYLLFLTLLLVPTLTLAAELKRIPATASITAVTVYPDRALTSRSATLNLKPGSYRIGFDHLPPLIQDDSVRVAGKGSAGVTIIGLEVQRIFLERSRAERVQALDEEIRALEQRSAGLDAKKAGLAAQKAFLESIRVAWGERISKELAIGRPTAAELQEASSLVGSGVTKTAEQNLALDNEKQVLTEKLDALRRELEELVSSDRKESKSVEVAVEVTREGSLTLELSAVIPQAGWVPAYDVRLAPEAKSAELTFRALVHQRTGEDWTNVDLTLSTARPASGGAPPELYPWNIELLRPEPPQPRAKMFGMASPPPVAAMASDMYEERAMKALEVEAEAPAEVETALLSDEQSSVSFHIPRPLDIPADGSQHGSVVAIDKLAVNMEFMAIPKLSPYVFLKSEIVNQAAYPLLPGKINTFTGNTYTGSAQLKKVAVGEKFDLFFGTDDQVTVKRDELKQHKEAGVFGKNRVSYRYRIELNNFRKEPVTVTLLDQLPVAGDEEIKVSLDTPSIKPDEVKDDGQITWKRPLKAGEKQELTFGILVEYPKDREILGL